MKELMQSYASYNYWAGQELSRRLLLLSTEQQEAEMPSSFRSIKATIIHLWDAESIWWQRLKLHENIIVPSLSFHPTTAEALNGLLAQSQQWKEWVDQASVPQLEHVFAYQNSKKELFKQPVWQMLMHVFNHGTFHRGQIVTMLRQLGEEKIPQTDFIIFTRSRR